MDKHCRGCMFHHNAGHKKKDVLKNPNLKKYNDWCRRLGRNATEALGHCKNLGKKVKRNDCC